MKNQANTIQKTVMLELDTFAAADAFGKSMGTKNFSNTINNLILLGLERVTTIKKHDELIMSLMRESELKRKEEELKRQNDIERIIGILINNRKIEEEIFKTTMGLGRMVLEDITQNKRLSITDSEIDSLEEKNKIQKSKRNAIALHEVGSAKAEENIQTILSSKKPESEGKRV